MTGTSKGIGKCFMDFDNRKSQEWLRRRKLRLEQVRKQSSEIARALRQKVINGEKMRMDVYNKISQANFRNWRAEKMDELQFKLNDALQDFGGGHKEAEVEPDAAEIMEQLKKINSEVAEKRGRIALKEAKRKKKQTEEKKMSPVRRKKLTRKKEDLRSALVRSVTTRKNLDDGGAPQEMLFPEKGPSFRQQEGSPEKLPVYRAPKKAVNSIKETNHYNVKKKSEKLKRKKMAPQKSSFWVQRAGSGDFFQKNPETIWINLNDIQSSSGGLGTMSQKDELGFSHRTIVLGDRQRTFNLGDKQRSGDWYESPSKSSRCMPEGGVEFYDFTSRFHCRTFREHPYVVERISSGLSEPNATELAEMEEEELETKARKWEDNDVLIRERGMEALRRERINRDYSNLVSRLEDLHKKEKVLKSQQRNEPNFFHMSEKRLNERLQAKQRVMDSKFVDVYYDATSRIPPPDSSGPENTHRQGGGDWTELQNGSPNSLTLTPSSYKLNTPVATDEETSQKSYTKERTQAPQNTKVKNLLLSDIERTLREGRELRKSVSRNRDDEESEAESWISDPESVLSEVCEEKTEPITRTQECQTENFRVERNVAEIDVSLPVSTSTCYRSPPSCSPSHHIHKFLDYLEGISEPEDLAEGKQALKEKIDKIMCDLLHDGNSKMEEQGEKSTENLTLEYYIGKLLTMSRECVANLSVSSENISTPNGTDLESRELETKYLQQFPSVEEIVKESRLSRAEQLQETIRSCRRALGDDIEEDVEEESERDSEKDLNPEPEDVPDCGRFQQSELEPEEPPGDGLCVIYSPKFKSKYEEITKKCSARISELSRMLDKVREDKEKLLSSGSSSLCLSKDDRDSVKDTDEDGGQKISPLLEGFVKKLNLSSTDEHTPMAAVVEPKSMEPEDTLESWPDVMEELLKKNILTSPFKWSEGEYSSDLVTTNDDHPQPSSIETVVGNFRKEINRIKPFTFSDSFLESNSTHKLRRGSGERQPEMFSSPRNIPSSPRPDRGQKGQEDTFDSIQQALTSLGLNWAKSFLRKNEESKAINSSSNSERKSSDSEDGFP